MMVTVFNLFLKTFLYFFEHWKHFIPSRFSTQIKTFLLSVVKIVITPSSFIITVMLLISHLSADGDSLGDIFIFIIPN